MIVLTVLGDYTSARNFAESVGQIGWTREIQRDLWEFGVVKHRR